MLIFKMKKIYLLLLLSVTSCKSQVKTLIDNSEIDNEILTVFFNSMKPYSYIDTNLQEINLINQFIGNYNYNIRFYKNADSICKNSDNFVKLKFYCPIADSFSKFYNILNKEDLVFLKKEYYTSNKLRIIELDTILSNTIPLLQHSKEYYEKVDYNSYLSLANIDEFPSIRILNIFYNEDKTVAIIPYRIIESPITHTKPSYFILKKIKNIWWKPIGNLKL